MKNSKKVFSLLIVAVLVVGMLSGCGSSNESASTTSNTSDDDNSKVAEVVELSFANGTTESMKAGAEKFKEVAESESNGTLKINIFPDNQLGSDRVQIESTQFGDIDIGTASTSPIATMYHDFYIFDAPYLFLNNEEAYSFMDGDEGVNMLDGMEEIGLKGLAFWENGFRETTSSDAGITSPEDMDGVKIRTMENDIHIEAWKAWGANPTPMAFTEVFTALQQGTIDGQENPLGTIDANKIQEVQEYVSMTDHVYTPFIVAMNLDKYNSLTDEQKSALEKAASESTLTQREASKKINEEILDKWATSGVTVVELTDEEKQVFRDKINEANIYDMVKEKLDHPEYLDEIVNK
jgi:tripartite ATP-independent transporter DctP family solute receptor